MSARLATLFGALLLTTACGAADPTSSPEPAATVSLGVQASANGGGNVGVDGNTPGTQCPKAKCGAVPVVQCSDGTFEQPIMCVWDDVTQWDHTCSWEMTVCAGGSNGCSDRSCAGGGSAP